MKRLPKLSTQRRRGSGMGTFVDLCTKLGMTDAEIVSAVMPAVTDADRQSAPPADPSRVGIGEMSNDEIEALIARATREPATYPTKEK